MRHQLALEMLAKNGACLPHSWIAGNDEMGSPYGLWRRLAAFRWCWTGAAAWGRVVPLGWLQGGSTAQITAHGAQRGAAIVTRDLI